MDAGIGAVAAELPGFRHARQNPLGVPGANAIERFAGDDIEIPGLGIEGGRRPHGHLDHFSDQRLGNRHGFVAANAPAPPDDFIVLHDWISNVPRRDARVGLFCRLHLRVLVRRVNASKPSSKANARYRSRLVHGPQPDYSAFNRECALGERS